MNILSNSLKFTPEDGSITVGLKNYGSEIVMTIKDSGIGMSEKEIYQALEPFSQVDSSLGRAHEGTGLGLPLVVRFVKIIKGKFDIDSVKGEGTTVTITLPNIHDEEHI